MGTKRSWTTDLRDVLITYRRPLSVLLVAGFFVLCFARGWLTVDMFRPLVEGVRDLLGTGDG